jgi:hypothetical protein
MAFARDRFGDWNSPTAVIDAARWTEARREELLLAGQGSRQPRTGPNEGAGHAPPALLA